MSSHDASSEYWDYTHMAKAYLFRAPYASDVLDAVVRISQAQKHDRCCDIGAGTANLTLPLAERGLKVDAVEPNRAMRECGIIRTKDHNSSVRWIDACGEATGLSDRTYALVTFGSSFNVVDKAKALREAARLLRESGWFLCLWNHRDLHNPLQAKIESIIRRQLPHYSYGDRRDDPTEVINASGLFAMPNLIEASFSYTVQAEDWINAWRSHATLARQAGDKFVTILDEIAQVVRSSHSAEISVPYVTRGWIAKVYNRL